MSKKFLLKEVLSDIDKPIIGKNIALAPFVNNFNNPIRYCDNKRIKKYILRYYKENICSHPFDYPKEIVEKLEKNFFTKLPVKQISFDKIFTLQKYIDWSKIHKFVQDYSNDEINNEYLKAPCYVIKFGKEYCLIDGNHRAISNHIVGEELLDSHVFIIK